jgi:hypothetical protein
VNRKRSARFRLARYNLHTSPVSLCLFLAFPLSLPSPSCTSHFPLPYLYLASFLLPGGPHDPDHVRHRH